MPGRVIIAVLEAFSYQNQLWSRFMSGSQARLPGTTSTDTNGPGSGWLASVLAVFVAAGLSTLILISQRAAEPVILAILAVLGVLGVFFLFGFATGHVRLGERTDGVDLPRVAADSAEQGLMIARGDGASVFANEAFRAVVGSDAGGQPRSLEVAFAGEPQATECLFRLMRAAERGETRIEEFKVRGGDARSRPARWLRLAVRPMPARQRHADLDGAALWTVSDITGERAREAEVTRDLEETLSLYGRLSVGLIVADADGRITHINPMLAGWLGLDAASAVGRGLALADIVAGSGEALVRAQLLDPASTALRLELDLVREDGVGLPVELIGRVERVEGRPGTVTAVVVPRTPRVLTGPDAVGAEAGFARIFNAAPFGIASLGSGGRVLGTNAAFVRMFLDMGRLEDATIPDLIARTGDQDAQRQFEAALEEARAGRAWLSPVEVSFGPDRQHTRRLYLSPITDTARADEVAMLFVIDATEQKALELKYAQSTKMEAVGKLAGGIAHDFNNVLTAIIGFSDLLLQMHRPTDAAYKDIMNIKQNANRAAGMVRQLLAFSRRQTLKAETLELGEVLGDLSVLLNRLIGEKVELKIVSGRDLWLVKADRTQLDQVIMNLAVNAKDAMPDGGRLTIRTRNVTERESLKLRAQAMAPGEYVLIEVDDTGTGMSPEVMAKIFEPFFSTKDVGKGTGLGLSTVYGIVKQTGGYIFPESTIGKGTTFRIYFPRHIPEVPAQGEVLPAREVKKERPRDLTGTGRVLLVEDEDAVRSFVARALKRQGYEVMEATTGVDALEVVAREQGTIDIVVSDVVMPEMDGPTMLNELRKSKPDLKVIFVSGYPDDRFKTTLDPSAQFAFLQKPFTLSQLAAKVKEEIAR